MKTKSVVILVALMLTMVFVPLAQAATTPVTFKQTTSTSYFQSPLAATKCRTDSHYTMAANTFGWKIYKYTLNVSWCYDGTKAWVTGKSASGQTYLPGVSYKGTNISILGDKTRYVTVIGNGKFVSSVGIPTPWGNFGPSREAHPWVKIVGYYYGNIGKSQEPF